MHKFQFRAIDKVCFYLTYLWYKLVLPLEVRHPRWKLWAYEWAYSAAKFKDYQSSLVWPHDDDRIATRFGAFRIRADTSDAAAVSPAFERRDINYLLRLVTRLLGDGRQVLFLDVGADLGTYSVTLGNRFRDRALRIAAFEPVPASCALLRQNVEANGLSDRIQVHEVALMDRNDDDARMQLDAATPGSSTTKGEGGAVPIRTRRLEDLQGLELDAGAVLVIKIDVEGAERNVLEGAAGMLSRADEVYLVVEDFIDTSIIEYLEATGWAFVAKCTTYNSWWRRRRISSPDPQA